MNKIAIIIIIVVVLLIIIGVIGYIIYRRRKTSNKSQEDTSQLISGGKPSSAFDTNLNLNEAPPQYTPTNVNGGKITSPPCPPCPDCKCPDCPACNCPVNDQKLKSANEEVSYLKWMVKFLGSIARRENAINRAIMKECPTTFSMVPMIQSSDQEYRFIKKDIGKDHELLNYFNANFTKLSGIPSTSYEEIL